jgi:hypothetical protein
VEEVTMDEILVLYDNLLQLQDLTARDYGFKEKFGFALEAIAMILKTENLKTTKLDTLLKRIRSKSLVHVPSDFLIPKRNITQVEGSMKRAYRLKDTRFSVQRPPTPPKRFIGIGYRDKGSARDKAWDGSPHWTEVAMSTRIWE